MPQNMVGVMQDRLLIAVVAGVVGWWLGWASASFTAWLHPPEEPDPGRSVHRRLLGDPLVQGTSALVWAAIPVFLDGDWLRWAEAGLLTLPLTQVAVTDLRTRYVYTFVVVLGLGVGLAFGWHVHHVEWWWSAAGAGGGGLAFGALYLIGRAMFGGREAMARGDIWIGAMVGAGAAACAAQALVLGLVASAPIALIVWMRTRSPKSYMPYGPGLCIGGLLTLFLC